MLNLAGLFSSFYDPMLHIFFFFIDFLSFLFHVFFFFSSPSFSSLCGSWSSSSILSSSFSSSFLTWWTLYRSLLFFRLDQPYSGHCLLLCYLYGFLCALELGNQAWTTTLACKLQGHLSIQPLMFILIDCIYPSDRWSLNHQTVKDINRPILFGQLIVYDSKDRGEQSASKWRASTWSLLNKKFWMVLLMAVKIRKS